MSRCVIVAALACSAALLACGSGRHAESAGGAQGACERCHGDGTTSPVFGLSNTSDPRVGAHLAHVQDGPVRQGLGCDACHAVPHAVGDPGHFSGTGLLAFGPLATANGRLTPRFLPGDASTPPSCSQVYCHGATLQGGRFTQPVWTRVDGAQSACDACHGYPPPPPHLAATRCEGCHGRTVRPDGTVDVAGGYHVNGRLDVTFSADVPCGGCHEVPPATGSHAVHFALQGAPPVATYGDLRILQDYAPQGGPGYAFGCGNCHPLDAAKHGDGAVEVELHDPAAPAGSLKARNGPGATYAADRTCGQVYCHGSGQDAPAFQPTPAWDSGARLGCDGCHGNPPRYPSGGAGTATANSHLVLGDDGWELGHFLGMPGAWHPGGTKHGGALAAGQDAAPITCQACHAGTVDPGHTGPSGFYWLDTSGSYQLPGGDPARLTTRTYADLACTACHGTAGGPAAEGGAVLPRLHVNGRRDVVFDARTALPGSIPWLPAAPDRPTRPYWVTSAATLVDPAQVPGAVMDGTTLSVHLADARWDPATKTCTSVGCHLAQTSVRWGTTPVGSATCGACHGLP
ncbi:CxxxxCH/CxxCH domain c-type cytochrome [Anaeromyxobacter paludicola]|uniref:Cytochrome C family protein n=1 Tax=Anaeromyxobacter paludicola TaxID=2918171 RepID=A0ABM7XCC5_9BACT|nr:CxxxxCH/CxxCH domain-containing protein [Anaeromyxobacter paludicola]BDG09521.1 hypothetical protein AMPC_26340 [Anaeromyxobacter paludicola]